MGLFTSAPQLLTDGAIYAKVRELIVNATERLVLISPYIDPSEDFVRQLEEAASSREVDVQLVFRKDKATEYRATDWFRRLAAAGVNLAAIERLHSKIYRNEFETVVTSMNFYTSSGENSFEVGVFFEEGHKLADQVDDYLKSLERHMERYSREGAAGKPRGPRNIQGARAKAKAPTAAGHCIRCADAIPFNRLRPYCPDDFEVWNRYKNEDFEDKHCHRCGEQFAVTMRRPLCRGCFEQVG